MSGNPLVRFDEGRVGRTASCRPLSYSTVKSCFLNPTLQAIPLTPDANCPSFSRSTSLLFDSA